tara:strand:+ start:369 stop:479 length:111 start_codon:yes stop_codon:yes gene_type:complete
MGIRKITIGGVKILLIYPAPAACLEFAAIILFEHRQ